MIGDKIQEKSVYCPWCGANNVVQITKDVFGTVGIYWKNCCWYCKTSFVFPIENTLLLIKENKL